MAADEVIARNLAAQETMAQAALDALAIAQQQTGLATGALWAAAISAILTIGALYLTWRAYGLQQAHFQTATRAYLTVRLKEFNQRGPDRFEVVFETTNCGQTPANDVQVGMVGRRTLLENARNVVVTEGFTPKSFIHPGQSIETEEFIDVAANGLPLEASPEVLLIKVFVRYKDASGQARVTAEACYWGAAGDKVIGAPEGNYAT